MCKAKVARLLEGQDFQPGSRQQSSSMVFLNFQAALDGEVVSSCSTINGKSAFTGQRFIQGNRPELAGIDAKTILYLNKDNSAVPDREAKRCQSENFRK